MFAVFSEKAINLWPRWHMVRRRAHDSNVLGSKPPLATVEESILGQGVNTNCASLHPGV